MVSVHWAMIEIKHLRLLQALSTHGTLSAAARELGYSQPAATQQIQRLEAMLRTPVFTRTGKSIRLTEAGEVLLRHGATVLPLMSLARAEIDAVAGLRSNQVRVASFSSAAATLLPKALAAMMAAHPGITFTLVEALPDEALKALRNGDCDLALVYNYTTGNEHDVPAASAVGDEVVIDLMEENIYVALPSGHPLGAEKVVRLADLKDSRWIAGCPSCRGNLVNACELAGFDPVIAFETDDYVALENLVAAGLGVALVSDLMLAAVHLEPALTLRRLSPSPTRMISLVSSKSLLRVPGVRQTVDSLRRTAHELELVDIK